MIEHDVAGIHFFAYDLFDPCLSVTNVVTTRHRGRSAPPYDTLNLGLHVGDDPEAVLENRAIVSQILGFEPEAFTLAEQVHGSVVAVVRSFDRGKGSVIEDDALRGADAMITNESNVPLAVLVADCMAISFYDPGKNVIGLAHAGWKGTLGRIAEKTIEAMAATYGSSPLDVLVGLSPSIGPCHYEVGRDVADAYREAFGGDVGQEIIGDPAAGYRLDLWEANTRQLLRAGVSSDHIEVSRLCTACTPEFLYSYRRDGSRTGRFAGIITLHHARGRLY